MHAPLRLTARQAREACALANSELRIREALRAVGAFLEEWLNASPIDGVIQCTSDNDAGVSDDATTRHRKTIQPVEDGAHS